MRLHPAQVRVMVAGTACLLGIALPAVLVHAAAVPPASSAPASAAAAHPAAAPGSVPASADVSAIAFPTAASGWAAGTGSSGTGSGSTVIWHTDSAGASWQAQWRGSGKLVSLTATDPAHAWAIVGRQLLGTTDGTSWHALATLPKHAAQVRFATASLGVVITDGCLPSLGGAGLPHCPGQVLVSHNGGSTWTRVLTSSMPVFAAADAQGRLWAAEPAASAAVTFLTSGNGGRSWSRLSTVRSKIPLSGEVDVTLALGGGRLAWASVFDLDTCAMHGCLVSTLSSGNGGRTWRPVNLPDKYPDECGSANLELSTATDGSVWIGSSRNGAACAPPLGLLYRDTGSGWRQLPPWQLSGLTSLDAVTAQVAYAIGDVGVLARTEDGGQHWTQLLPSPVPTGTVDAVSQALAFGAQDGVSAGAVLRGDPGGWSDVAELPGVITRLDLPTSARGIAVTYAQGSGYRLWSSTDGGTSWTAGGALPKGPVLIGPWLSADGHGLLLTERGGEPWDPATGGTGQVREWVTSDWGATWHKGATVPFGRAEPSGPVSFAYANGHWTGWLSVLAASSRFQVDVISGGRLSVLPGKPPTDNVQLVGPGAGFAWGIEYHGRTPILELYRTTNAGHSWQRNTKTLSSDPAALSPMLSFSSAQDGWLVTGHVTLTTTTGGRTWT